MANENGSKNTKTELGEKPISAIFEMSVQRPAGQGSVNGRASIIANVEEFMKANKKPVNGEVNPLENWEAYRGYLKSFAENLAPLGVHIKFTRPPRLTKSKKTEGPRKFSVARVNQNDVSISDSSLDAFAESLTEKLAFKQSDNQADEHDSNRKRSISIWTNRVAIWRFFERYGTMFVKEGSLAKELINLNKMKIQERVNFILLKKNDPKKIHIDHKNPFAQYGRSFSAVFEMWQPVMKKMREFYVHRTMRGGNFREDFDQLITIAFLYALERQAMAIISNAKMAQKIPFPSRLRFAIRKIVGSSLPDMTGPIRIPYESEERKQIPSEVSYDQQFMEESVLTKDELEDNLIENIDEADRLEANAASVNGLAVVIQLPRKRKRLRSL